MRTWTSSERSRKKSSASTSRPCSSRIDRTPSIDSTRIASSRATRIVESARARSASFQAVHGDAHIGNVMATERGAIWTDWEDAFVGPIEYDIACLRSKADLFGEERDAIDAMLAAYGADYDRALATDLGLVRNVQVIAWLALFAERQPELLPRMRARIDRLPRGAGVRG